MHHPIFQGIRNWPNDWDIHVMKTCDLYFDGRTGPEIRLVDGISTFAVISFQPYPIGYSQPIEEIRLQTIFTCNDKTYTIWFDYKEDKICGVVFHLLQPVSNLDEIENLLNDFHGSTVIPSYSGFDLVRTIGNFSCSSAFNSAQKIEEILSSHKDFDDDDDFDFDLSPEPDPVPSGSLTLDPILSF